MTAQRTVHHSVVYRHNMLQSGIHVSEQVQLVQSHPWSQGAQRAKGHS